ncbi:unnamed protein product [Arabis nemorensis]|uniref:Uncharacterized protein n=1 Tax=Arabis nemorensis TaxID=586526 RepID=A0A565CUT3_9BRAS|nr:unnamed protein product [Arabis nemorensis]
MVLKGEILYILTPGSYIRTLDFSGQDGFKDVSYMVPMYQPTLTERQQATKFISQSEKIAVTRSGEVLMVDILVYEDAA